MRPTMAKLLLLLLIPLLSSCASLKRQTGEYVVEAVQDTVNRRVDEALAERGLTRQELVSAVSGADGVTQASLLEALKDTAREVAIATAEKKAIEIEQKLENHPDPYSAGALVSLLILYLLKQVGQAKADGVRDTKLAMVEKLLQKDLDGDGKVG